MTIPSSSVTAWRRGAEGQLPIRMGQLMVLMGIVLLYDIAELCSSSGTSGSLSCVCETHIPRDVCTGGRGCVWV